MFKIFEKNMMFKVYDYFTANNNNLLKYYTIELNFNPFLTHTII